MNDDNEVELSDFGISRLLNGAPSGFTTGTGSATYAFAAPEYMLNPELYSTALDVYSFGLFMLAVSLGISSQRPETRRLINHEPDS